MAKAIYMVFYVHVDGDVVNGMAAVIMISFHLKYAINTENYRKRGVTTGPNMRISNICGCKTGLTLLCRCVYSVEAG